MSGEKVAIIAVHGVGSPEPGATARDIAALLQQSNPGVYSEFCECSFELNVAALTEPRPPDPPKPDGEGAADNQIPWYVRSRFVRSRTGSAAPTAQDLKSDPGEDVLFTREAIDNVSLDDEPSRRYRTLRLGAGRSNPDGSVTGVDVYEFYWADLSRIGGWLGKILGEFYQILFHLASIGQKTVELAWLKAESADQSRLKWLLGAQTVTEAMLAAVLPTFIMVMLFATLPVLIQFASPKADLLILGTLIAIVATVVLARGAWQVGDPDSLSAGSAAMRAARSVAGLVIAVGLAHAVTAYLAANGEGENRFLLVSALSVLAFLPFAWCVSKLAIRRRERMLRVPLVAAGVGTVVWVALYVYGFRLLHPFHAAADLTQFLMLLGEGLFALVALAWMLFIVAAWLSCLFGFYAAVSSGSWRVRAAIWTGKIGIVVPASLFFVVNLVAWQLLAALILKIPDQPYESLVTHWRLLPVDGLDCRGATTIHACVVRLLDISAGPGFNAFMLMVLIAAILLLTALLPSILHESSPTDGSDAGASARLGTWLDMGMALSRVAGYVLLVGFLVVLPGLQIAQWFVEPKLLAGLTGSSLLQVMGTLIVSSAGIAVAFRGVLFKGLTRAIGIAFDVDNWLKEAPIERNPRGRIARRFLALLRQLSGQKYDRIVIVSHSQGTVIAADLLRYLQRFPDPQIACVIRLTTFGSPIRQLYGRRFPHLYAWAREEKITTSVPDMYELFGVERWVNGYRSGDYIGRYFWTGSAQWTPVPPPAPAPFVSEFCLGAGAHTHYFDVTGMAVGRLIDANIP